MNNIQLEQGLSFVCVYVMLLKRGIKNYTFLQESGVLFGERERERGDHKSECLCVRD